MIFLQRPWGILILIIQERDCKPLFPSLLTNIQTLHCPRAQMRFPRWLNHWYTATWEGLGGAVVLRVSVQFSHSVVSDSVRPRGLQHARPPCPSPTPGVYPNSGPLSQWCHPTISSSVIPFSCPQSFLASGAFQMSQLFALGGQSIGVSASTSTFQWTPGTDLL